MANLTGSFSYVTDVEVTQDGPLTENLYVKLGTNDNFLKDALDSEIATRASEDSLIRGAGPYQSLTTLKGRLDNANKVVQVHDSGNNSMGGRIQTMSGLQFPTSSTYEYVSVTTDGGTYRVEKHSQPGISSNISRSVLYDTTIPTSSTTFFELSWQSSFANMFYRIRVFEIQGV